MSKLVEGVTVMLCDESDLNRLGRQRIESGDRPCLEDLSGSMADFAMPDIVVYRGYVLKSTLFRRPEEPLLAKMGSGAYATVTRKGAAGGLSR